MKKHFLFLIFCAFLLSIPAELSARETIRIGMVFDGQWEDTRTIFQLIKGEIEALTADEFEIILSEQSLFIADWTPESNQQVLDRVYQNNGIDLVIVVGIVSTNDVVHRGALSKPTVATLILDTDLQKAPLTKTGTSGVRNLSYTAFSNTFNESIEQFHRVVPFTKVAWIVNRHVMAAIPGMRENARTYLDQNGIAVEYISIEDSIERALSQISEDVDAVVVAPQSYLSSVQIRTLADGLIAKKLPSLAITGKSDVELGMMVSLTQNELDYLRLSRRIALNVQSILLGEKPESLPVFIEESQHLTVNMATARAIGFSPTWDTIAQAELIHPEAMDRKILTITEAVREAVEKNLTIAARDRFVAGNAQNIRQAWSRVLPQLNLNNTYARIDEDRARAAMGMAPEETASGGASVSQILYSEQAFANIAIQKAAQRSREMAFHELKLDIALNAAVAYLNVLKAKNLERIQSENLRVSRENLRLAKTREDVGQSGPADVYRWESQIATNQRDVIRAKENYQNAQIQLNRLLHRPLEEEYLLEETKQDNEFFVMDKGRIDAYTRNPHSFKIFRDFFVREGLDHSPEIKQIDAQINAQERTVQSARRKFWQPEISAGVQVTDNYFEDGAGVPGASTANDRDTTFSIQATFPLFEGGNKIASHKKESAALQQFRLERAAQAEQIEERIRTRLHTAGVSSEAINLSKRAAEFAHKNLGLISEAYSEGTVNILDLIDAQNSALNADLVAENATIDFMVDVMEVQRAVGYYFFMLNEKEREEWSQRFELYFKHAGVKPAQ